MDESMEDDFYVIGIDFGTTYSGVAWCFSQEPNDIKVVTRWDTRQSFNSDSAKTPTEIHYGSSSEAPSWGYDIPPEFEPIKWFKLLLVDEQDLAEDLRNSKQLARARQLVKQLGKTAIDVITDYLSLLWDKAIEDIIQDRGEQALNALPIKVWLTVPAIWRENAREGMRMAARKAGILKARLAGETTLDLVAEPEAAAIAVLDDLKKRPDVQVGDSFVVCDAGGGTVDIISYSIRETKPMTVGECVEGKGKLCGAIFVDQAFESMIKARFGSKWEQISATGRKTLMNNEWEFGIKKRFDGNDKEWTVQAPMEFLMAKHRFTSKKFDENKSDMPMRAGQIILKQGHIRAFFETVIPHIRGLINNQISAVTAQTGQAPKAILLVGGFGSCRFLYQEIDRAFKAKGVMVWQSNGSRPWTAICRGAVMRGLSEPVNAPRSMPVVSRISRVNYGTDSAVAFIEGVHDPRDRKWYNDELEWKACNQMKWYLRRGDSMSTESPIVFNFYNNYKEAPISGKPIKIFENHDLEAPSRMTERVHPFVEITPRFTLPFESFPEFKNRKGETFRRVRFGLQMDSDGVTMKWKVFVNGELQGSKDVDIIGEASEEQMSNTKLSD